MSSKKKDNLPTGPKKELFLQLVDKKAEEFAGKMLFYKALGEHCGRDFQTAQRWVSLRSWPDSYEVEAKLWDFFGYHLDDKGEVRKVSNLSTHIDGGGFDFRVGITTTHRDSVSTSINLQEEKLKQVYQFLKISTDEEFLIKLGASPNGAEEVRRWREQQEHIKPWAIWVMHHNWEIPETWWNQEGVPLKDVIGKGLGKDEGRKDAAPALTAPLMDFFSDMQKAEKVLPSLFTKTGRIAFSEMLIRLASAVQKEEPAKKN